MSLEGLSELAVLLCKTVNRHGAQFQWADFKGVLWVEGGCLP